MKWLLIVLCLVVVLFLGFQLFWRSFSPKIETYPFQIEKEYEDISIRRYDERLFIAVKMEASTYKSSSRKGFSVLANYIFGGNKKNEKIAMTSPVSISLEDSMTMMFMVPKKYSRNQLPEPNSQDVLIKEVPVKRVAVISFGGWADDKKIAKHKKRLIQSLTDKGIAYTNKFCFLGYNPPFELFNRKNEIVVELQ